MAIPRLRPPLGMTRGSARRHLTPDRISLLTTASTDMAVIDKRGLTAYEGASGSYDRPVPRRRMSDALHARPMPELPCVRCRPLEPSHVRPGGERTDHRRRT